MLAVSVVADETQDDINLSTYKIDNLPQELFLLTLLFSSTKSCLFLGSLLLFLNNHYLIFKRVLILLMQKLVERDFLRGKISDICFVNCGQLKRGDLILC